MNKIHAVASIFLFFLVLNSSSGSDSSEVFRVPLADFPSEEQRSFGTISSESSLRIVSREDWHAKAPSHKLTDLEIPSTRVIIASTNTPKCTTRVFSIDFILMDCSKIE